ncbi:PfkB family carbohydrate kinase [Mycoplasmopsis pullorum]|uniref:Carbohydrate kinase PfkB domain-containing protein n=1 Tax=Mycoplasmopsis pullorum TaxID=48003 RepID=A0A1L4FR85_9BACT|nr:PfkB family carbohydrate kinase [Mycoplasmopsis pullorum]APJ38125.1 hypothetical protein BLA55_00245 [Mycoplasmopsis pullorum]
MHNNSNQHGKVLTIGEVLVRLSILKNSQLETNQLNYYIGGDTLNVAANVGRWINGSKFFSVVDFDSVFYPNLLQHMNANNVESQLVHQSGRIGTYYTLPKNTFKNMQVFYDRKYSSYYDTYETTLANVDSDKLLSNVEYIFISGITLALNSKINTFILKLIKHARTQGIKIILDLNYRSKLWSSYDAFRAEIEKFIIYADVVIGWISQVYQPLSQMLDLEQFKINSQSMLEKYPNIEILATPSKGFTTKACVKSFLFKDKQYYESDILEYEDRFPIGSGDSFASALVTALLLKLSNEEILNASRNAYAIKNIYEGDNNLANWSDILGYKSNIKKIER